MRIGVAIDLHATAGSAGEVTWQNLSEQVLTAEQLGFDLVVLPTICLTGPMESATTPRPRTGRRTRQRVRGSRTRGCHEPDRDRLACLHQLPNTATSTWAHHRDHMIDNLDADRVELDRDAINELASITRRWSGAPHLHPVS